MTYYARSANSCGKRETVAEHVLKVANYAKKNASFFDKAYEGEIVGKYHDFGKYGLLFQKVLLKEETKVNHEIAGALFVEQLYKNTNELQIVIASHHKGLDFHNNINAKQYFNYMDRYGRRMSIETLDEFRKAVNIFNKEVCIDYKTLKNPVYTICKNPKIEQMLYIRMLLSALVDADYTAAAEHDNSVYSEASTGPTLDAKLYLDRLYNLKEKIKKSSFSHSDLNNIRDSVFNECLLASKKEPGLFTLTAPTGTGKTLALFAFALSHAEKWNKRRIILVLPFLSIIEQNAAQYTKICPNLLEDHSQSVFNDSSRLYADRWNSDVIVTTSVKFFESLFKDKPSDCRLLHNISDSVIVFDEAQSLPHNLLGSSIETINALCQKYKCTVLFATATQPFFSFRNDLNWKPKEIINDIHSIYKATERVRVDWKLSNKTSFEAIANDMCESKSCCAILNIKKHSVELFNLLQDKLSEHEKDSLFHISTDMCVSHRKKVIKEINNRLTNAQPCRLVSTQCIEAGVDLDFELVYRALAPLDAIIQSAGRCNRNGRLKLGRFVVFIPEEERYPDEYYKNAANKVKLLAKQKVIDINNPQHIKEYYSYLYSEFNSDKPELIQAIARTDFAEVSKQYKLISNPVNNVIVPYKEEQELFDEVTCFIRENGLTAKMIEKARPISVSVYSNKIEDIAERVYFKSNKKGLDREKTNWFVLLDSMFYNEKTGLQINKISSLNTIC